MTSTSRTRPPKLKPDKVYPKLLTSEESRHSSHHPEGTNPISQLLLSILLGDDLIPYFDDVLLYSSESTVFDSLNHF